MKIGTLCYVRSGDKTLMLHRVKKQNDIHEGKWNGLGGKVDPGETPEECVIREVREESGLMITKPRLCGVITFPMFDGVDDWYVFVYTVDSFTGKLVESNEGDLKWIDNDKLFELSLWEGDKIFMKWLNGSKMFSAKFVYKDHKLSDHEVIFY